MNAHAIQVLKQINWLLLCIYALHSYSGLHFAQFRHNNISDYSHSTGVQLGNFKIIAKLYAPN